MSVVDSSIAYIQASQREVRRLTDENLSLHHELDALHHELDALHHELDTLRHDTLRHVSHAFSDFPCEQLLPYGIVTGDGFFKELVEEGTGFKSAVEPVHHPLQKPWAYRPTNDVNDIAQLGPDYTPQQQNRNIPHAQPFLGLTPVLAHPLGLHASSANGTNIGTMSSGSPLEGNGFVSMVPSSICGTPG